MVIVAQLDCILRIGTKGIPMLLGLCNIHSLQYNPWNNEKHHIYKGVSSWIHSWLRAKIKLVKMISLYVQGQESCHLSDFGMLLVLFCKMQSNNINMRISLKLLHWVALILSSSNSQTFPWLFLFFPGFKISWISLTSKRNFHFSFRSTLNTSFLIRNQIMGIGIHGMVEKWHT